MKISTESFLFFNSEQCLTEHICGLLMFNNIAVQFLVITLSCLSLRCQLKHGLFYDGSLVFMLEGVCMKVHSLSSSKLTVWECSLDIFTSTSKHGWKYDLCIADKVSYSCFQVHNVLGSSYPYQGGI